MRFAIQPILSRIWHAPDNFRLMDPLPLPHRRGIIAGFILMILGILLPSSNDSETSAERAGQLDFSSQPRPDPQIVANNQLAPQQAAPVDPQPVTEPQDDEPDTARIQAQTTPDYQPQESQQQSAQVQTRQPARQQQSPSSTIPYQGTDSQQQWRSYELGAGKTLAQLFRDNNLPPSDVYAMAQVQGDGSPLSSLKSGQVVQIRQNSNGVVTGLAVDVGNQQVVFSRQSDGSFMRTR